MNGDPYTILQVREDAEIEVIRLAYKALAKKYHPDVVGRNPAAEAQMTRINEAYRILSEPRLREQYDRSRRSQEAQAHGPPGSSEGSSVGGPQSSSGEQPGSHQRGSQHDAERRDPRRTHTPAGQTWWKRIALSFVALFVGAILVGLILRRSPPTAIFEIGNAGWSRAKFGLHKLQYSGKLRIAECDSSSGLVFLKYKLAGEIDSGGHPIVAYFSDREVELNPYTYSDTAQDVQWTVVGWRSSQDPTLIGLRVVATAPRKKGDFFTDLTLAVSSEHTQDDYLAMIATYSQKDHQLLWVDPMLIKGGAGHVMVFGDSPKPVDWASLKEIKAEVVSWDVTETWKGQDGNEQERGQATIALKDPNCYRAPCLLYIASEGNPHYNRVVATEGGLAIVDIPTKDMFHKPLRVYLAGPLRLATLRPF